MYLKIVEKLILVINSATTYVTVITRNRKPYELSYEILSRQIFHTVATYTQGTMELKELAVLDNLELKFQGSFLQGITAKDFLGRHGMQAA